ncbi:DUF2795 domain-containing protein [Microbacterium sp. Mu-80]|uniref:DUF2795 domain-containing protein n=1 Tax=Microbacterium bandirmense TaxID=3122050 RepID=A0ABU8LDN3_9MICO
MSLSPSIERFLAQMEYPAAKDDLLREATRDGLNPRDVEILRALRDGSYSARREVLAALRRAEDLVAA